MNTKIYTIFDTKVEAYMAPFTSPQHGSAIRAFTDTVLDEGTTFHAHPEDYTLFYIGDFDPNTGLIEPALTPVSLVKGNEVAIPNEETE